MMMNDEHSNHIKYYSFTVKDFKQFCYSQFFVKKKQILQKFN